jgi:hypothetical protein
MLTAVDRRPQLWERRQHITRILAAQREARAKVCGCSACKDQDQGVLLDRLIRANVQLLAGLSDAIAERPSC